ncbi:GNAT family N-acetyltransferase [Mycobacterium sp. 236(2023)]|uniref:GNAT family N-acetyltransferase n=1 Tax=Mycobacterium sp. 236(2023) TaxID=3038163 RepID=UPI002414D53F|nr:GNAT family N-acetyltransferase [Mycobacterium sp. 236(2023)]MDG4666389.1 GNAT family N-acetyltransferase [Mycobacterium sp. 236(2023)]
MLEVSVVEPGELSESDLTIGEALVRRAFGSGFRSHDWLHGVDGVHVVISDGNEMLAHASVVTRMLRHNDNVFRTGYVEAVAVRADQQGRGLGRLVMDHAESVIRVRHDLGALNAVKAAEGFYVARGWVLWDGPTRADASSGTVDTYDPVDLIYLLPANAAVPLDTETPLICDWRPGDLW